MVCLFNSKAAGPLEPHLGRWHGLCRLRRRRALRWLQRLVGTFELSLNLVSGEGQVYSICENERKWLLSDQKNRPWLRL